MISIGSKVVAIGTCALATKLVHVDDGGPFTYPNGAPKKGQIYVVIGFVVDGDILGLKLIGIPVFHNVSGETGWDSRCFRELDELKSELRLAKEMQS